MRGLACDNCNGNSRNLNGAPSWYDNLYNEVTGAAENLWNDVEHGVWELGNALGPGSSPMMAYPEPDIGSGTTYQTGDAGAQSQLENSQAIMQAPAAGGQVIETGIGNAISWIENNLLIATVVIAGVYIIANEKD